MATNHPLIELTVVRLREFLREPEALFWSFLFPILMTCALGVAFSSQSEGRFVVGVAEGPGGDSIISTFAGDERFTIRRVQGEGSIEPRRARWHRRRVVVFPGTPPTYRYDARTRREPSRAFGRGCRPPARRGP